MHKLTLIQRFSLYCFIAIVVFAIAFGWIITSFVEKNMITRAKEITAQFISEQIKRHLEAQDVNTPKIGPDYNTLAGKVNNLILGSNIVRIRIWDRNQVIVWSDEKRLVGQQFLDNEELNEALQGRITSEITALEKSEQKFERKFKRLLELYIPLKYGRDQKVSAVFEIYQNLDPLYEDISKEKKIIWATTILGFGFLYLMLFGIVKKTSNLILALQKQTIKAERQSTVSLVAGSIGHELNNSITALSGYAELLTMNPKDCNLARECSAVFNTQCERLKVYANNLLALSKPSMPEIKLLALTPFLDRVTELLVVSGILKFFTIRREYTENLPMIQGDEMMVEQVIRNLEINAAHAMDKQGVLTIGTKLSEDKFHVEFFVADTGHGIPEDIHDRIFLPFFTTKEAGKGTGLGMYIVKQIVEQHRGYINVDSKVNVGTKIIIGLPAV